MIIGYSDTGKLPIPQKLRDALEQCQRNHGCRPVEIQVNPDDRGELESIDGIPIVTTGRLVANRNMFWFKLPGIEG